MTTLLANRLVRTQCRWLRDIVARTYESYVLESPSPKSLDVMWKGPHFDFRLVTSVFPKLIYEDKHTLAYVLAMDSGKYDFIVHPQPETIPRMIQSGLPLDKRIIGTMLKTRNLSEVSVSDVSKNELRDYFRCRISE
ncbi:hypothetical protein HY492_01340 [Candidatus Woesearchaeota archaeon]|nr:hypothetical protein [Candidatus Woesearchaeota archaeon]